MNDEQQKVWDALTLTDKEKEEKHHIICDEADLHSEWSAEQRIDYIYSKSSYVSKDTLFSIQKIVDAFNGK